MAIKAAKETIKKRSYEDIPVVNCFKCKNKGNKTDRGITICKLNFSVCSENEKCIRFEKDE